MHIASVASTTLAVTVAAQSTTNVTCGRPTTIVTVEVCNGTLTYPTDGRCNNTSYLATTSINSTSTTVLPADFQPSTSILFNSTSYLATTSINPTSTSILPADIQSPTTVPFTSTTSTLSPTSSASTQTTGIQVFTGIAASSFETPAMIALIPFIIGFLA